MLISKRLIGGAKCATLLAMSWAVGVALESLLETAPASASTTLAQATATTPVAPARVTSWWQPVATALR